MLKGVRRVIDLGIAPGGWSQVVRRKHPDAVVVGIDLLPVDPIEGVTILQMDFIDDRAPALPTEAPRGAPELVLSERTAHPDGHHQPQSLRKMKLVGAGTSLNDQIAHTRRACVTQRREEGAQRDT